MRFFEFSKEEIDCLKEACEDKLTAWHEAILNDVDCEWTKEYLLKMVKRYTILQGISETFSK